MPEAAEPRPPARAVLHAAVSLTVHAAVLLPRTAGGVGAGGLLGAAVSALVAGHGRVRLVDLEVGGGDVEEQQVDLTVQQACDLPEHLALQLRGDLDQPVHRPVTGVVGGLT
ncbi:hypothetical protein ACFQE5_06055 [Pseudonocardia hispaniensis]|uniref:Uncharacterized protein n=1 Tax=Pseudonocardia hispaniensis TaxID=904933 RepID=A0ABW1IZY2_9PSEU